MHLGLEDSGWVISLKEPPIVFTFGHEGFQVVLAVVLAVLVILKRHGLEFSLAGLTATELLERDQSLTQGRHLAVVSVVTLRVAASATVLFGPRSRARAC